MALADGFAVPDPIPVRDQIYVANADRALAALEPVRSDAALRGVNVGGATAGAGRSLGQRLDVVLVTEAGHHALELLIAQRRGLAGRAHGAMARGQRVGKCAGQDPDL